MKASRIDSRTRAMVHGRPGALVLSATAAAIALLVGGGCTGNDGDRTGAAMATTTPAEDASADGSAIPPAPSSPSSTEPATAVRSSAGCGSIPAVGPTDDPVGDVPLELVSGGVTRRYRLAVPSRYDPAEPVGVVLDLHGSGSNADQQSVYSQLPARARDRGYLVVTPDGIDGIWELSGEGADDDFLMALLDDVERSYCIDLDRVHAVGISLGSWKATITACTHPDRFASLVLVAEEVAPAGCAMPVVAFHGTADAVVPYGDGADEGVVVNGPNAGLPGVDVNMATWAANGGCSPDARISRLEPDVEHRVYPDCHDGVDVELYSIDGGGHTWPGAPIDLPALGATTHTVDATGVALDWFDAHTRRT